MSKKVNTSTYGATDTEARDIIEAEAHILADLYKLGKISIGYLRYDDSSASDYDACERERIAAGGYGGHSGYSFSFARARALELLNGDVGDCVNTAIL